jgi:hypothetical protein
MFRHDLASEKFDLFDRVATPENHKALQESDQ